MPERAQQQRHDALALPQFCGLPAVFTLLVVGELVVLISALAPDSHMGFRAFSTASAFVVWLALLCALALCKATTWFAKLPARTGYLAACAMLVLIVAAASALVGWLDHALDTGLTPLSLPRFVLGNAALAALLGAALLRYFYVLAEWRARLAAVSRAQFEALQARIRPHFLFNSMNTVAALIRIDPNAAERTVEDLTDLFRAALGADDRPSTLGAELALVDRYLAIEQLRLGDRLRVERDVAELPDDLEMPSLLLQPLVENAVYHGIQPLPEGGVVRIRGRRVNAGVEIEIDNPLPPDAPAPRNGHAQDNVRRRIAYHFGMRGALETLAADGRYTVIVRLPHAHSDR
ncbi:MAG: histidine kinase [Rhodanobacteraceae bacterium]|nr:histidine kinase [Pseudomonadota bacterium]